MNFEMGDRLFAQRGSFFERAVELEPLHGAMMWTAVVLIALLLPLLPRELRRQVFGPVILLALHVVFMLVEGALPDQSAIRPPVEFGALLTILCSIGRSSFLLVVRSTIAQKLFRPLPKIFVDIVQGLIYVTALLIALSASGVPVTSLLTGSALVTAVLGLSMRDTLGNIFAGLSLQVERPFAVGDWIQFDNDSTHVGLVEELNWRATKVLTLDQVEIIVPNAQLAQAAIRNFTKPTPYSRRSIYVAAPYEVPTRRVHRIVLDAISESWGVLKEPPPSVVTLEFNERGVQYWVRFFTVEYGKRDLVDSGVRDRIWYALQRNGIAIPPPLRLVQIEERGQEAAVRAETTRAAHRRQFLRCVDFLAELPDESLEQLAMAGQMRLYADGERVIRQGEPGDELFVIVQGEVAVSISSLNAEVEICRLRPPSFFGELSLMTGERRSATVTVVNSCEVFVVNKAAIAPVLAHTPDLAEHISETLAVRQARLQERRLEAAGSDVRSTTECRDLLHRIRTFFSL